MTKGVQALIFTDCVSHGTVWQRSAGAYRMATELRKKGLTVQVIDYWSFLNLEGPDMVLALINKFVGTDTLFVAWSTTFMSIGYAGMHAKKLNVKRYAQKVSHLQTHRAGNVFGIEDTDIEQIRDLIKERSPTADIVVAGSRVIEGDSISTVRVFGYGEQHFADYIEWKLKRKPLWTCPVEKGVRLINTNPKADGFDFANSIIEWDVSDCIQPNEALPIEVSRGCIFKCKFCSYPLNGKSKIDYLKDTDVLRQEFLENYRRWGTTRYVFADDTYNDSTYKLEWMQSITDSLPFKLEFVTYLRLDLIAAHPEQIELLESNGLIGGFFGIESLYQPAAKSIGKGMDPERLIELLHRLRSTWSHRVTTMAGLILGLPHDTYATMEKWCERVVDHRFPLHTFEMSPLGLKRPTDKRNYSFYSELDRDSTKFGYEWNPEGWYNTQTGTSYAGCNELGTQLSKYAQDTARLSISPHIIPSVMAHGLTQMDINKLSRLGVINSSQVYNKTHIQYMTYVQDIFNVETE